MITRKIMENHNVQKWFNTLSTHIIDYHEYKNGCINKFKEVKFGTHEMKMLLNISK